VRHSLYNFYSLSAAASGKKGAASTTTSAKAKLAALADDPFLHPAEVGIDKPGEAEALQLHEPVDQELAKKVVALEREHAALVKEVRALRGQGASQVVSAITSAYDTRLANAAESAAPMLTRSARALQSVGQQSFPLSKKANAEEEEAAAAGGGRRRSRGSAAAEAARAALLANEQTVQGKIARLVEAKEEEADEEALVAQADDEEEVDDQGKGAGGAGAAKGGKKAAGRPPFKSKRGKSAAAGVVGLSKKAIKAEEDASKAREAGFAASLDEMADVAIAYKDQKPRLKAAMKVANDTVAVVSLMMLFIW
jgi:hypothetical protein